MFITLQSHLCLVLWVFLSIRRLYFIIPNWEVIFTLCFFQWPIIPLFYFTLFLYAVKHSNHNSRLLFSVPLLIVMYGCFLAAFPHRRLYYHHHLVTVCGCFLSTSPTVASLRTAVLSPYLQLKFHTCVYIELAMLVSNLFAKYWVF